METFFGGGHLLSKGKYTDGGKYKDFFLFDQPTNDLVWIGLDFFFGRNTHSIFFVGNEWDIIPVYSTLVKVFDVLD